MREPDYTYCGHLMLLTEVWVAGPDNPPKVRVTHLLSGIKSERFGHVQDGTILACFADIAADVANWQLGHR